MTRWVIRIRRYREPQSVSGGTHMPVVTTINLTVRLPVVGSGSIARMQRRWRDEWRRRTGWCWERWGWRGRPACHAWITHPDLQVLNARRFLARRVVELDEQAARAPDRDGRQVGAVVADRMGATGGEAHRDGARIVGAARLEQGPAVLECDADDVAEHASYGRIAVTHHIVGWHVIRGACHPRGHDVAVEGVVVDAVRVARLLRWVHWRRRWR